MADLVQIVRAEETGVASLVLNRPDVLNALDVALANAFRDAVEEVARWDGLRALVITGAGRAFVAGGDVAAFGSDVDRSADIVDALLDALHPALVRLRGIDAPVIAAVKGVAAGAGLSLVLNADLVIAEEGARFVIAYDRIGASPDCGATWFLARKVGPAKAAEMMFLGATLDAQAAREAGMVSIVAPSGSLESAIADMAAQVARGPTKAFGQFKRLADGAFLRPLAEQLEAERAAFVAATQTNDFREGVGAFLAKRPATFTGS